MAEHVKVAIIGAGLGGIGMGVTLKEAGEGSFVLLEKADRVGGTWRDNRYPGAACDVQSHLYWFSFDRQPDWSRIYPGQEEILANIERLVDRHRIRDHVRLNAEVRSARWDDGTWTLTLADGRAMTASAVVTAWGQLNRPSTRGIPGVADFAGDSFHSARWREDVPLEGRRVAVIGNGPSAAQLIPEVARVAAHLTVLQRSPNYVVPRADRPYTDEERRTFLDDPAKLFESREGYYLEHETWHQAMRLNTPTAAEFGRIAREVLDAQVADPVLRERLWPTYPVGCKRLVISDDFLPTFNRPNVTLVTDRIERIEPTGIRTADGALHEADVIIYGTGFETHQFLAIEEITGRDGRALSETWREAPEAYLGMAVAGFPNLFMLYGPNTNLGHNSILLMLECQYRYILEALYAGDAAGRPVEVKPDALAAFNARLQQDLRDSSWAGNCVSWYKTADGRIVNNWSGSVEDYRASTARVNLDDYQPFPARETEHAG